MTQLYSAPVDREGFLSCLSGKAPTDVRSSTDYRPLRSPGNIRESILLVWRERPRPSNALPNLVIVDRDYMREFFAFTSTYVSTYFPFSTFFPVLTKDDFNNIAPLIFGAVGHAPLPAELVGVMISEAFVQLGPQARSVDDVSIQASLATLSGVLLQGLTLGLDKEGITEIASRWKRVRNLFTSDQLRLSPAAVADFWGVVAEAINPASLAQLGNRGFSAIEFVRSVIDSRRFDPIAWARLTNDMPDFRSIIGAMGGSREDRIRILEKAALIARTAGHVDRSTREITLGYLISLVADGSFAYMDLSTGIAPDLPTVPLWFAFFAGLNKNTDVLSIGGCLGRRLDLLQKSDRKMSDANLMDMPSADISIDELLVLAADNPNKLNFRTRFSSSLDVEIYPGVNARFRTRRQVQDSIAPAVDVKQIEEIRFYARRLIAATDKLEAGEYPRSDQDDARSESPDWQRPPRKRTKK